MAVPSVCDPSTCKAACLVCGPTGFARDATHSSAAELSQYVTTRWYRAPEVIVGGDYGTAVDVWAFGEMQTSTHSHSHMHTGIALACVPATCSLFKQAAGYTNMDMVGGTGSAPALIALQVC